MTVTALTTASVVTEYFSGDSLDHFTGFLILLAQLEPTLVPPLDGDGGGGEAGQLPQRGGDPQRLQILLEVVAALELPRPKKRLHLDYFSAQIQRLFACRVGVEMMLLIVRWLSTSSLHPGGTE